MSEKVYRIDLTGHFKNIDESNYSETNMKGEVIELPEIHKLIGELLYNHLPKDKTKLRCAEMAKKLYNNKVIDLSTEERDYLKMLVDEINLKAGLHQDLHNRINKE